MSYLPLLQAFQLKQESPATMIIIGVIFVVVILLLIISGSRSGSSSSGSSTAKLSKRAFRKRSQQLGLNPEQIRTLENLISKYSITDYRNLLGNTPFLDSILKKAIKEVSESGSSPEIKEAHKLTLYRIKQTIERNSTVKQVISSSKQIKLSQPLTISPDSGGRFKSRVTANLHNDLAVEVPVNAQGNQVRLKRWTPVKVFFWKSNGQGFTFTTKVSNYAEVKGYSSMLLKHVNSITQAQQRKYRRKMIEKPSYFYPVRVLVTGSGKNQTKKPFVETKNGALGTMIDVSSGGCCIKSTYPLAQGELIKVEFETSKKNQITTYGKVVSMRKIQPLGGLMHVMFTKISKGHLNKINDFVYDLGANEAL